MGVQRTDGHHIVVPRLALAHMASCRVVVVMVVVVVIVVVEVVVVVAVVRRRGRCRRRRCRRIRRRFCRPSCRSLSSFVFRRPSWPVVDRRSSSVVRRCRSSVYEFE